MTVAMAVDAPAADVGGDQTGSIGESHGLIWADLFAVLAWVVLGLWRFGVLRAGGAPPTIDAGNWLAFGDSLLGDGVRPPTIVYPPVVPLLTKASVALFGLVNGVSIVAAVASAAPAIGVYIGLRMLGLGSLALAPALLILGASSVGEAAAWGGFPQLLGLGLVPIALILLDRFLRSWSPRDALMCGVSFMALLATSHFVGFVAAAAAVVMVAAAFLVPSGPTPDPRLVVIGGVLLLLPLFWLAPLYLTLFTAAGGVSTEFKFFNELEWSNLLGHVEFLYRGFPWLWRIVLPAAIVAPFVFRRKHRTPLWRVTSALLVGIAFVTLVTREARFLYFLMVFAALGSAIWLVAGADLNQRWTMKARDTTPTRQTAGLVAAVLVAGSLLQIGVGFDFFRGQRLFYGLLSPELVTGIESVRDSSQPKDVLAVTSLHDAPLGWWVEAIGQRETYYGAPLRWLLFEDEIARASFANDLFKPPFPNVEALLEAQRAGIDLILVPTRWVFFVEAAFDDLGRAFPGSVEYVSPELLVIDTALITG